MTVGSRRRHQPRRVRSLGLKPWNLNDVFVALHCGDSRLVVMFQGFRRRAAVDVCRESLPMLGLNVPRRVLVQVEMHKGPLLGCNQQGQAKAGCKLLSHLVLY